jgi:hypothetical protein
MHFPEETRARGVDALPLTGGTDVLTGEPADNGIDGSAMLGNKVGCKAADVVVLPDGGPMRGQHGTTEGIDFAESTGRKSASRLKSVGKTANP